MTDQTTTARPRKSPPTPQVSAEAEEVRTALSDRIPPHDLSLEAGVLGSMVIDKEVIGPICMILQSEDAFFRHENRVVFRVLLDLYNENKPIDAMILHTTLKHKNLLQEVGGIDYIKELASAVPTSAHAEFYAIQVKELWERRMGVIACVENLRDLNNSGDDSATVLDRCEARIFDVAERKVVQTEERLVDLLHNAFEALDRKSSGQTGGLKTGFIELDNLVDGLGKGDMIVLAARPSVGKTALAMGIAEHVGVDLKIPVGVMSMEMSGLQLVQRMLCARSGVDSQKLRRNMMSKEDRDRLNFAVGMLAEGAVFIDDTPAQSLMMIRTKARRMVKSHGIQLLIVDYLQLMEAHKKAENRQQEITTISRGIKALARDLNIPILCLSQLNRSSETESRLPRSSDLRESGSIEQDSDVVLLLHREAVLHRGDDAWERENHELLNQALLIVAKQRNGPCGNIKLSFFGGCTKFANYNPGV